jgi:hypothetical protein
VVVGCRDRVGVAEVDLVLTRPGLALRRLDAQPGRLHRRADAAQERFVVRGREQVIVEDVRHRGRQLPVVLRVRLGVRLAEEEELELRAEHRRVAESGGALDLRLQHLPGRRGDRRAVVPRDVRERERGALEPWDAAQRREVRHEVEVAVPALPARDRVTRLRVHLHVETQQIVAALDRVPAVELLDEEARLEALPHQPPLHVGERHGDRVDVTAVNGRAQLVEAQHRPTLVP